VDRRLTPDELAKLTQHPIGAEYRYFTEQERELLRESIQRSGVQTPILLYQGQVLDGWHRRQVCVELGKSAPVEVLDDGLPEIEAARRAYDANVPQRHLTPSQLAMWAAKKYELTKRRGGNSAIGANNGSVAHIGIGGETKAAQRAVSVPDQRQIADEHGVSLRSVQRAHAVRKQDAEIAQRVERGDLSLRAAEQELRAQKASPHVARRTGEVEWYTPPYLVEAARRVMGGIDLDPASSARANEGVRASRFFDREQDGLQQPWSGRVWLNPPYARGVVERFVERLVEHVARGDVTQAVMITNNATDTNWCQLALAHCQGACFVNGRVKFLQSGSERGVPLQGQVVTAFGPHLDVDRFRREFRELGEVFVR